MKTFDQAVGQVIAASEGKLWFRAVKFVVMAWIWVFIFMFLGYLTLVLFGQAPTTPLYEVPGVPIIPPFNDSEFLGRLGSIGVTTTQAIPLP